jgi:hypothetical protein
MLELPKVTLVVVDTLNYGEAIQSIKKSLIKIKPAAAKYLTDIKAYSTKATSSQFDIVKINKLDSKEAYSRFIIKELDGFFDTDYVLVTQHDGWVLDEKAWSDEFMEYDYIGAAWLENEGPNVGNGGFSLRSKKLQHILATDDFIQPYHPEDNCICKLYRPYLEEKYGIKFAPDEVADKFSFELREPIQSTFGFHGNFHKPYQPTVVIKRSGALGDCIAAEPLMHHFHENGYRVVVDMPVHLAMVYINHYFPVFHISQMDPRVNATVIDLDGAYEKTPERLHLKSYYHIALVPYTTPNNLDCPIANPGIIRNPKLQHPGIEYSKMFKKYCVLHIDERDQPYRNVYGVNWEEVVQSLVKRGYTVIQAGLGLHENIKGAIQMHTATNNFLLYLVAGADLFIGVDSGPAAMAVACSIPSVIFFGSVDSKLIHPDLSNVCVIERVDVCKTPKCWSSVVDGVTGLACVVNEQSPPCTQFDTSDVIYKIDKFLGA